MTGEPLLRRLIGDVLRERRTGAGRTLREVAAEARVSVAYLSEIERGRKEASSEVLAAVCRALGMALVDLLGEAYAELLATAPVLDLTARGGVWHGPRRALGDLTGAPAREVRLAA